MRNPTDWSADDIKGYQELDVVLFCRKGRVAWLKRWWSGAKYDEAAIVISWNHKLEVARMQGGRLQYFYPLDKWPGFITSEGLHNRKVLNFKSLIGTENDARLAIGQKFKSSFHAVAAIFCLPDAENATSNSLLIYRK